jgi:preprotein translocase subunit SecA
VPKDSVESQWRTKDLEKYLIETYDLETNIHQKVAENKKLIPESIAQEIIASAKHRYEYKYIEIEDNRLLLEKQVMLQVLDVHWKEHLAEIDHLRNSIGLRAYAQKNPKNEFKREAYSMFESMLDEIDSGTVRILFSLQIANEENANNIQSNQNNQEIVYQKDEAPAYNEEQSSPSSAPAVKATETVKREEPKIGRNDFVKITNGEETKEIKFKKAKPLIDSGEWKIV